MTFNNFRNILNPEKIFLKCGFRFTYCSFNKLSDDADPPGWEEEVTSFFVYRVVSKILRKTQISRPSPHLLNLRVCSKNPHITKTSRDCEDLHKAQHQCLGLFVSMTWL